MPNVNHKTARQYACVLHVLAALLLHQCVAQTVLHMLASATYKQLHVILREIFLLLKMKPAVCIEEYSSLHVDKIVIVIYCVVYMKARVTVLFYLWKWCFIVDLIMVEHAL